MDTDTLDDPIEEYMDNCFSFEEGKMVDLDTTIMSEDLYVTSSD